ncbi:MAG: hypothetical protein R3F18_09950 [Lysobacterales bacterium]
MESVAWQSRRKVVETLDCFVAALLAMTPALGGAATSVVAGAY